MKSLILLFLCFPLGTAAQHVVETVYKFSDNYFPVLSSESSSSFSFKLYKIYEVGGQDTSVQFFCNIADSRMYSEGGAIGVGFANGTLGGSLGVSAHTVYSVDRGYGEVILDYERFHEFYEGFKSVYSYMRIIQATKSPKRKIEQLVSVQVGDFAIVGARNPRGFDKYYLRLGNATFTLEENDIDSLWNAINQVGRMWKSDNVVRS